MSVFHACFLSFFLSLSDGSIPANESRKEGRKEGSKEGRREKEESFSSFSFFFFFFFLLLMSSTNFSATRKILHFVGGFSFLGQMRVLVLLAKKCFRGYKDFSDLTGNSPFNPKLQW